MKLNQVAMQLFTLREFCKTATDYAATLKRVREIGYQGIQLSGLGPIPESELRSIAEGEGLPIVVTHEPGPTILDEPNKVADRLAALGAKYTAYPYPSKVDLSKPEEIETLIAKLDAAGAVLRKAGRQLTYHNHAFEFTGYKGKTVLDAIYDQTSPENLQGELDTYWVQAGGGNPAAWCARLKNRLPLLHLKDYAVAPDGKPFFAEVGYGNLDFKQIIAAAEASGCEWLLVEQDTCPGDPFESARKSFEYIKANLIS